MNNALRFISGPGMLPVQQRSSKLLRYGILLLALGIAAIVNGSVATAFEAVKLYYLVKYVNTHWITSIYVLAGCSVVLMEKLAGNFFLYSAICLNLVTGFVAVGAFLFDCVDLNVVVSMKTSSPMYYWGLQRKALIVYNSIDLVIAANVLVVCVLILREIYRETSCYFPNVKELRSRPTVICGVILLIISVSKNLFWAMEYRWMNSLGQSARYVFLNYTMDEPVWNMIHVLVGALITVVGYRGTAVLAYCSIPLLAATFYPTIQYLWIDYRWLLTIQLAEMSPSLPKPTVLLVSNITVSLVHIFVTFLSLIVLTRSLSDCALLIKVPNVRLTTTLKTSVYVLATSLVIIGIAFLASDVGNVVAGTFYRVLYNPSEQKLPFLFIPAGVLCVIAIEVPKCSFYTIPVATVFLALCFNSTLFHIAAYVYLAYNDYFGSEICQLFAFSNRTMCTKRVEQIGSAVHFLEALLAEVATVMSLCGVFVFGRVCGLYQLPNFSELRLRPAMASARTTCRTLLKALCLAQMAIGTATCIVSLTAEENFHMHPLMVTHNVIYRTANTLALVVLPTIQLALTSDVDKFPMKLSAIWMISIERMINILTLLDYRNLTFLETAWTVMTVAEILTLLLQFVIMNVGAVLFEVGQVCSTITNSLEFADELDATPNPSEVTELKELFEDGAAAEANGVTNENLP